MEKRYEIKFYVGTGYDKTGRPIENVIGKLSQAELVLTGYFRGATAYLHSGLWAETPASRITAEDGVTYVTIIEAADLSQVRPAAEELRDIFNQTCILVTRAVIEGEFI